MIENTNSPPIEKLIIDRTALGVPFEAIDAELFSLFSTHLTLDYFTKVIDTNKDAIADSAENQRSKIEKNAPYNIIIESIDKLRRISEENENPHHIIKAISVLQTYLNFFVSTKKTTETTLINKQETYIQNAKDLYTILVTLEQEGLIEIKESRNLKKLCKVEDETEKLIDVIPETTTEKTERVEETV
uniref:Uncharacterized protein n=1 Tax=viral metagenome TaxID=1070528 RepID=A0A6M3LCN3_9ZZZZ